MGELYADITCLLQYNDIITLIFQKVLIVIKLSNKRSIEIPHIFT